MIFLPCLLSGLGRKWVWRYCILERGVALKAKSIHLGKAEEVVISCGLLFEERCTLGTYIKSLIKWNLKNSSLGRSSIIQNHFQNLKNPLVCRIYICVIPKMYRRIKKKENRKQTHWSIYLLKIYYSDSVMHFICIISGMLIIILIVVEVFKG